MMPRFLCPASHLDVDVVDYFDCLEQYIQWFCVSKQKKMIPNVSLTLSASEAA